MIVAYHFSHICTKVMALDLRQNFVSAQYLENKLTFFSKFYICIDIEKVWVGIVSCHFLLVCNRVMALELCQNFIST